VTDWVDTFVEYSKARGSPELFRRWAAISAVAATLERRVWLRSNFGHTYPNLFIVLVGSPASGKSVAANQAMSYPQEISELHFAPNNVSRASLIDALAKANRIVPHPGAMPDHFNALTAYARELAVLIPGWDSEFMAHLTDLWDCEPYREEKRGGDLKIFIENTWLNLLGCCPPNYLSDTLPITAWESGFISRTILVYSAGETTIPLMLGAQMAAADARHSILRSETKRLFALGGEMLFTDEAAAAMIAWNNAGCPPRVTHPRLQNYNGRRTAHMMKLCMVASASRGSDLTITLEDYQRALGWLSEAERNMPGIFVAMQTGGDAIAMRDTWDFVMRENQRTGDPVRHPAVMTFLAKRINGNDIQRVLAVMVEAEMLVMKMDSKGMKAYEAGPAVFH
jgi:hypothetical protein